MLPVIDEEGCSCCSSHLIQLANCKLIGPQQGALWLTPRLPKPPRHSGRHARRRWKTNQQEGTKNMDISSKSMCGSSTNAEDNSLTFDLRLEKQVTRAEIAVMASLGQQRQGHVRMRGTKQTKRTILIWHILCFHLVFDNKPSGWQLLTSCFRTFLFTPALVRALPHWLVKNTMASISPHQAALSLKRQGENIRGKKDGISLPVADSLRGTDRVSNRKTLSEVCLRRRWAVYEIRWGRFSPQTFICEEKTLGFLFLHLRSNCTGCRFLILQFKIFIFFKYEILKTFNNSGQIHTFKKTPPHKGQMVKEKKTNETMFSINYFI